MGPLPLAPPGKPKISMIRGDKTVAKTVSYDYLGNIQYALHRTKGANLFIYKKTCISESFDLPVWEGDELDLNPDLLTKSSVLLTDCPIGPWRFSHYTGRLQQEYIGLA